MTLIPPTSTHHTPAYRRQRKNSGHDIAFVRLNGKRIYLGAYDSPESHARYHQLVAEWEMAGRLLPAPPTTRSRSPRSLASTWPSPGPTT